MKTHPLFLIVGFSLATVIAPALWANADNTGNNTADRSATAITPESQSNAEEDVAVTRAIRRALVADPTLSLYAQNIKIITTRRHRVYLRGPVAASDDVKKITALARKNSNGYPVKNQLSVSSN